MSTGSQGEEDPPEIKYIDSLEFQNLNEDSDELSEINFRWVNTIETEEQKWFRILSEFATTLPGKRGYCFRIVEKYAKALNFQGAEVTQTRGGLRHLSNVSPRQVGDSANIPLLLKHFSETTKQANLAHYMSATLAKIGQSAESKKTMHRLLGHERLESLYLIHRRYKHGLENLLSNSRLLRHFRYGTKRRKDILTDHVRDLFSERDLFAQAPEASSLALQAVVDDWSCSFQNEKIVQLSHGNTLQMRSLHVKGDAYYFLNETLICALASNYTEGQEEIEDFDSIIASNSTSSRGKQLFQFWRLISKFERNRRIANPQGFLITAQRLEEECKSESIGTNCAVFIEEACKIRKLCDQQHDEIIKTITETVSRHPSLGPRMMQLAERCDVGYENEVFLHQVCDLDASTGNNALHPSEPAWLDYVENIVQSVGRFGSVRKTLEKSLKIMFEFLDFDANRFNERAWILFEKVLELTDPSFVLAEWKGRARWWPNYQRSKARDGRRMIKAVRKTRNDVLVDLEAIVI